MEKLTDLDWDNNQIYRARNNPVLVILTISGWLNSFDSVSFVLHIFTEKSPAPLSKQFLQAFFRVPGVAY